MLWQVRGGCGARLGRDRRRNMWQGQLGLPIRRSGLVLLDLRGADGESIERYGKLHRAGLHAGYRAITLWKKVVVRLGVRPCDRMGNEAILG